VAVLFLSNPPLLAHISVISKVSNYITFPSNVHLKLNNIQRCIVVEARERLLVESTKKLFVEHRCP
jgi:hypothetical protein